LARACAAAALASATAIALLATVSLAGSSGVDPLGLVATGLAQTKPPQTQAPQTKAPQTKAPQAKPPQTPAPQTQPPLNPVGGQKDGPPVTPKPGGPLTPSAKTYKVDAVEFFLTPDQFVEYKFRLNTGARMVFNWKATGPVEVDFHTVPDGKPISASETYQRGQARSGSGDYRSPYPGLHGWYWHNTGKTDVKLVLNASGFWTEAWMFSGDPTGDPMPLQDPPAPEN
jgi:hypothetical protein